MSADEQQEQGQTDVGPSENVQQEPAASEQPEQGTEDLPEDDEA